MILKSTNIEEKLRRRQSLDGQEHSILEQVENILALENKKEFKIELELRSSNNSHSNAFKFDLLASENIYHINTIKTICINYRLRFLDTKYFKNDFPQEAFSKIKALEKAHDTMLHGFKIMAPSKVFKLKNPDDPLLFAPIGNGYYYLIHTWGNDLHPLRKWLIWPFKNLETLVFTALIVSFMTTYIFNASLLTDGINGSKFLILFLFMFKSVIGVIIFYAFSQGKNFNTAIWDSQYAK
ncbi:hypothetical protein N7U66_20405 [Lacinutrix neustonica]|uniref:Uncharacterized protein n=1 Tax=Lacinutrix neustonica TaxID=2980107 RepID=A0A9E8MV81_9FLAO|nr:hypothetical protein [Lacinutrix neustonica]WAC02108.1 hypothetical protein N7U66_20405 [Lacinutrix neustonica]